MADGVTALPFLGGQQGWTRLGDGTFAMNVTDPGAFAPATPGEIGATTPGKVNATILSLTDGVAPPSAIVGKAQLYVDQADGDLKVIFGDGTVKVVIADT